MAPFGTGRLDVPVVFPLRSLVGFVPGITRSSTCRTTRSTTRRTGSTAGQRSDVRTSVHWLAALCLLQLQHLVTPPGRTTTPWTRSRPRPDPPSNDPGVRSTLRVCVVHLSRPPRYAVAEEPRISLRNAHSWDDKRLIIAGRSWDIDGIAAHLKVQARGPAYSRCCL